MESQDVPEAACRAEDGRAPGPEHKERHLIRDLMIVILLLLLLIAAGAAGFIWFALSGWPEKTELDLVANIDASELGLEGYDGEGILRYDEEHLASLIGYDGDDGRVRRFIRSVSYTVTPDTDISNGDTVTIKAEFDPDKAGRAGVKVVKDTKHIVIEELDEKDEEGYNYGNDDVDLESTDTFDDPEDDYGGGGNRNDQDYTGNDMYGGGGEIYVTMTAGGADGYAAVRDGRSEDAGVVVKLGNGIRIDVYELEDGWYKIATGAYKGCYVHESEVKQS